jgi:aminopeptidase-like protein
MFSVDGFDWPRLTRDADDLLQRLFPICRSITGNGVRETLSIIKERIDIHVGEVPSGTTCYDWTVPDEWNIREAWIEDASGNRLLDFKYNNLYVVNYSAPVDAVLSFQELREHIHTMPELPDATPYRTSYYNRTWGFCMEHKRFLSLSRDESYHVKIDSSLEQGSLTYADLIVPGTSGKEFLISTYCCHPSLANDNLSGTVLTALLAELLLSKKTFHSYRIVIVPETIGAIAYLSMNETAMRNLSGGFVVTTVAGPGKHGYKQSFLGNSLVDRVAYRTFDELGVDHVIYPFSINGSDERQYSAPHFRIPVGTVTKDKYYEYEYYHTSLDNLSYISAANIVGTLKLYASCIEKLEMNRSYKSLMPYCEPMLGKRNLYPKLGGAVKQNVGESNDHYSTVYDCSPERVITGEDLDAMGWLMFCSDGRTSLLDIAERTNLPMRLLHMTAQRLVEHDLLAEVGGPES